MLRKKAKEEDKKKRSFSYCTFSVSLANFEIIEQEMLIWTSLPGVSKDFGIYSTNAENFNSNNQLPTYIDLKRAKALITPGWQPAIYLPSQWKPVYSIQVYFLQYHNRKGIS